MSPSCSSATEIDAKPSLVETAWSDPRLAVRMLFGPSLPYQYRLRGPHPWPGPGTPS
ncbi:flavin-containing monooxygenase, putative [Ixodes scapularis]|uniref:Flavin-containing monooxygenase n=1 Tax=Ixodes scapularis TaxID=6945 RepID=B7QF63_IXOSC|nr:flavin-containing monooxygenase, putative [Ixodes scapularis]|eukprot:XP_002414177.1 flavin-containing monooxygenase, putative [Ixodes scapularis]